MCIDFTDLDNVPLPYDDSWDARAQWIVLVNPMLPGAGSASDVLVFVLPPRPRPCLFHEETCHGCHRFTTCSTRGCDSSVDECQGWGQDGGAIPPPLPTAGLYRRTSL